MSSSSSSSSLFPAALHRLLSMAPVLLLGPLASGSSPALAISGGGLDYAEAKIADQDFSGKDLSKKDFSGAFAVRLYVCEHPPTHPPKRASA